MNIGAGSRPAAGGLASSTWRSVRPSVELSEMKYRDVWGDSSRGDGWFLKRKRSLGRATMSLHDVGGMGRAVHPGSSVHRRPRRTSASHLFVFMAGSTGLATDL